MDSTLKHDFRKFIRRHNLVAPGERILVAVSGGRDSMVLLHLLLQWQKLLKIELGVLHINHCLRGRDSDDDERFVRQICEEWKVPFFSRKADVRKIAKERGLSIEEAGHQAREKIFAEVCSGEQYDSVATAHHRRDQAETVLMRLMKGAGVEGLAGIRLRRPGIIRPLLFAGDEQIELYCRAHKILFREDKSNQDERFLRNQIRIKLLPEIEAVFGTAYEEHLLHTGLIFQDWLEEHRPLLKSALRECLEHASGNEIRLVLTFYNHYFSWLKFKVIDTILSEFDAGKPGFSYVKFRDFSDWLSSGKPGTSFRFNRKIVACKSAEKVLFQKVDETAGRFCFPVSPNEKVRIPGGNRILMVQPAALKEVLYTEDRSLEFVDGEKLQFPLTLRNASPSDKFEPIGMGYGKRVFDFLSENSVRGIRKDSSPVLVSSGKIVWVVGWRIDDKFKITKRTKSVYKLILRENEPGEGKN